MGISNGESKYRQSEAGWILALSIKEMIESENNTKMPGELYASCHWIRVQ